MRNRGFGARNPHPGPVEVTDSVWADYMGEAVVAWYKSQGLRAEHVCKCARFDEDKPWLMFKGDAPKYASEIHTWAFESNPDGPTRNGFPTSFAWTCYVGGSYMGGTDGKVLHRVTIDV